MFRIRLEPYWHDVHLSLVSRTSVEYFLMDCDLKIVFDLSEIKFINKTYNRFKINTYM